MFEARNAISRCRAHAIYVLKLVQAKDVVTLDYGVDHSSVAMRGRR
jgi:hypothetical protein